MPDKVHFEDALEEASEGYSELDTFRFASPSKADSLRDVAENFADAVTAELYYDDAADIHATAVDALIQAEAVIGKTEAIRSEILKRLST